VEELALVIVGATIIPVDPSLPRVVRGWLSVDGSGRIAGIGSGEAPAARQFLDAKGAIVAPGFVSSHSHLFTSGSRGMAPNSWLYDWIQAMTRYTEHANAEDIYWFTLHGALDFIGNGITTAYDFCASRSVFRASSHGRGDYTGELKPAEFVEAQYRAKLDSKLRFIHSLSLEDHEGDDDKVLSRVEGAIKLDRSHGHLGNSMGVAISGAAQWSDHRRTAGLEAQAMKEFGVINQAHLLETPFEIERQRERFWWYDEAGAVNQQMIFGHFIHTDQAILERVRKQGAKVSWQPTSNARLGSGILDVASLLDSGIPLGIGLDDQSCTDLSDPWQNMRMASYLLRASRQDARLMPPDMVLRLATLGSAEIIGIADEVGTLAPGKQADFLIVDPTSPDVGPLWDPVASYVFAIGPRNLKQVCIGGELVWVDGRSISHELEQVSHELHARLISIAERVDGN
jgi:5-methylthioadenosine/S-adenosylhomocysteine deaminase